MSADTPTPDELVARARALVPALRGRQAETERQRRVLADSVRAMKEAGLYRVQQPRHHGGLEYGLDSFVRVGMEIASGCGSTGWVFATGAQHQWQIGMYHPDAQDEVWGNASGALAASSYAPTGTAEPSDGGYRVNGQWSFCSGVDVAQWMILGTRIPASTKDAPPGMGFVLVPKADFAILDTWDVFGLVGTGSKDIVLKDVAVPARRMLTHQQALSGAPPGAVVNPGALFRIPFFAAISICLCTALLGMAKGVVEIFVDGVRRRGGDASAPASLLARIGEATAAVDAATELVLGDCRDIMAVVESGTALTQAQRARNKADLGYAVRLCARAIQLLFEEAGAVDPESRAQIERLWRDHRAGAQHISMNWDAVGTLYGRVQLGLEPSPIQF